MVNPLSRLGGYDIQLYNQQKSETQTKNIVDTESQVRSYSDSALFMADDKNISEILSRQNIGVDDKNISIARSLIQNNISVNKENIENILMTRNKIDYISNNLTDAKIHTIQQNNLLSYDLDSLYDNLQNLQKNTEEINRKTPDASEVDREVQTVFGRSGTGENERKAVKNLMEYGVPVSTQNVKKVMENASKLKAVSQADLNSVSIVVGKELSHTSDSILKTIQYAKSGYYNNVLSETEIGKLGGELDRVIHLNGIEVDGRSRMAATNLVKNGFEISNKNINSVFSMQDNLKQLSGVDFQGFGAFLAKKCIDPGTSTVESIVQQMKEFNDKSEVTEQNTEASINNTQSADEISDSEWANDPESSDINDRFDSLVGKRASEYAKNDTTRLYNEPSHSDIKRMDTKISEYLQKNNIEVNDENMQISRALIKNKVDVNKENIEKFKEILEGVRVGNINITGKGKIEFQGKTIDLSSIRSLVDKLEASKSAVDNIFGKNSDQYKSLLNLISKIDSIEFNKFSAIGMVMKNAWTMNIRNLDVAAMTLQGIEGGIIDISVCSEMELPQTYVSAQNKRSLADLIAQLGVPSVDDEISKVLLENEIPITKENLQRVQMVNNNLNNIVNATKSKEMALVHAALSERGIETETYPVDKLDSALKIIKSANNTMFSKQDTLAFKDYISNLKTLTNMQIVRILESGSQNDIRKMSIIKQSLDNSYSLSESINEIESGLESTIANKELIKAIKANLSDIRNTFQDTGLKDLKDGKTPADILNEGLKKIIDIKNLLVSSNETSRDGLLRSMDKIIGHLEEQNSIQRDQMLFQIPIYFANKQTNLNVQYFNRNSKKNGVIDPEQVSIALNLETESLGFLNINLDVEKKNLKIGIDANSELDKKIIEKFQSLLESRIEELGINVSALDITVPIDFKEQAKIDEPQLATEGKVKRLNGGFEVRV